MHAAPREPVEKVIIHSLDLHTAFARQRQKILHAPAATASNAKHGDPPRAQRLEDRIDPVDHHLMRDQPAPRRTPWHADER